MRVLTVEQVMALHQRALAQSGGSDGLRDRGLLESAVAQPLMTFGGQDLYETLHEKAAAMGFSLIRNHPFVDGNKRAGFLAMELFLNANGHMIDAGIDEAERFVLAVAAGEASREQLIEWLLTHCVMLK